MGQAHLVGPEGLIRRMIDSGQLVSLIFWGPPGSGKTTLAHIIASNIQARFVALSAVTTGVKELREVIEAAKQEKEFYKKDTILFIDEIHRWNKSQQDALLPHVERGDVILIGATTENPSFELNGALLSRCQVVVFEPLADAALREIVQRSQLALPQPVVDLIVRLSNGDGRVALNMVDILQRSGQAVASLTLEQAQQTLKHIALRYDKAGEEHFNLISALHKTMRASDVNAALYWAGRMILSGEDPLYVMRRVVEFASEDIGNADPQALVVCMNAYHAVHALGLPEGRYAIMQAVTYCATAPKSRAVWDATHAVIQDIRNTPNAPVPMHLRNAPTELMSAGGGSASGGKEVGYGEDRGEANLPEQLKDRVYYEMEGGTSQH